VCSLIEAKLAHEEKPIALLAGVKTELKEEPLTLEGEHTLFSVKKEFKEEADPWPMICLSTGATAAARGSWGIVSAVATLIACACVLCSRR
jgi:hypothetical protein